MKELEKEGFSAVLKFSFARIIQLPKKVHWRLILDLADFAKRESRFREAKLLFKLVSYLQPYAYQGWLEYSKMEEECGNMIKS
jgi:la-related protein 1